MAALPPTFNSWTCQHGKTIAGDDIRVCSLAIARWAGQIRNDEVCFHIYTYTWSKSEFTRMYIDMHGHRKQTKKKDLIYINGLQDN